MAYKITDDCISCGACESECPNQAISEGDTIYKIDPGKCSECVGANPTSKCAEVCPVEACIPDPDLKESKDQLLAKWKKIHPGETPKA
jgi:ferredoxin